MPPPDQTLTFDNKTYSLDLRAGALVNLAKPTDRIPFQAFEAHLIAIATAGSTAVKLDCISAAATFDAKLGRPQGSSTEALLALVNPKRDAPTQGPRIIRPKDIDRSR